MMKEASGFQILLADIMGITRRACLADGKY